MKSSWTISLDLATCYDFGVGGYDSTSISAKWIRTRDLWEHQDRVGLIIRSDCSSFRPTVSVTSEGRARIMYTTGIPDRSILDRPSTDHIRDRLEKKAGPKFFRNQHKVTKTFSIFGRQTWSPSNMMTNFKEGYSCRLPFYTKILHQEDLLTNLHPFCPSLELLSYDITYVT